MWTAGTYLSPIYELHSLRWTTETGEELTLTKGATNDLVRVAGLAGGSLNSIREEREYQSSQCIRAAWIETASCRSVSIASNR